MSGKMGMAGKERALSSLPSLTKENTKHHLFFCQSTMSEKVGTERVKDRCILEGQQRGWVRLQVQRHLETLMTMMSGGDLPISHSCPDRFLG